MRFRPDLSSTDGEVGGRDGRDVAANFDCGEDKDRMEATSLCAQLVVGMLTAF